MALERPYVGFQKRDESSRESQNRVLVFPRLK